VLACVNYRQYILCIILVFIEIIYLFLMTLIIYIKYNIIFLYFSMTPKIYHFVSNSKHFYGVTQILIIKVPM